MLVAQYPQRYKFDSSRSTAIL